MIHVDSEHRLFHLRNSFLSLVLYVQADGDGERELLMP